MSAMRWLTIAVLCTAWSQAFADDGQLLRKSMSKAPGIVEDPISEAEHVFIDMMKFYVPSQASNGDLTPIDYFDADGSLVETRDIAKPLVGVYIYGPVLGYEGIGFSGHGKREAYAAISLDDGNTWKRTNLSGSADLSSFTVSNPGTVDASGDDPVDEGGPTILEAKWEDGDGGKLAAKGKDAPRKALVEVINAHTGEILATDKAKKSGEWEVEEKRLGNAPCLIQAVADGKAGPPVKPKGTPDTCSASATIDPEYPGDVINIFQATAGNKVIVAWPSRFCKQGKPGYAMDAAQQAEVAAHLGIDPESDMYLTDLFGVAGNQGSIDFTEEGYPLVGEVPFTCLWTARGVLMPDPVDETKMKMIWMKAERLTSGKRDVNRVEVKMVAGAGAAITWQEDPDGLRPGQGLGPGLGWSGAVAHHQTDIWYSFLPWANFDTVDDGAGNPVNLADYTGTEKPQAYVPMAVPMRLSNNAKCTLPIDPTDISYCNYTIAQNYGLPNFCANTVEIPTGQNNTPTPICVSETGLPNVANTAATRARLSLQGYDSNGDGATDRAWVVVAAEESKGLGAFFFLPDGTPCTEGSSDDCVEADEGKNQIYYTFDMGSPNSFEDSSSPTSLAANLASQGNMLNQPEIDWRTGTFYPALSTADMWNFGTGNFEILRTEIARRSSLMVQSIEKAMQSGSGLAATPLWKQGLLHQGGPADVMMRRILLPAGFDPAVDNPYQFTNMDCANWAYDDGSNPYYPDGVCLDPAINLSATTPYECELGSQSTTPGCPMLNADGTLSSDPTLFQEFNKLVSWYQCPGSPLCGTVAEFGSNLDDQSWYNPLDLAKGHRGFLDGDFVMLLYAWSPNWKLNAVGHDRYELYVRRSFDGGVTWTTLPAAYLHRDGVTYFGSGTDTCETWRAPEGATEEPRICTSYAAGADEQARNVTQHKSMRFTTLDPRYAPTSATIAAPTTDDPTMAPQVTYDELNPANVRNPSRFFLVYETGDNSTVALGEAEPMDLFYARAVMFGDHYQVWAEETDLSVCYPSDPHGADVPPELVGSGFCNEFDDMEGKKDTQSSEASLEANPDGSFLYGVWAQWAHDDVTGELSESDAMVRRVWYIDDYIPTNAWTLPGTIGGGGTP